MFKAATDERIPRESIFQGSVAQESFDAYQYIHYLRSRIRFVLAVCAAAGVAVLIVSLLLPKQYTATASISIDPAAADDPRAVSAVNPAYLESLRSYELFASGDTIFQQALDKFHLRDRGAWTSLESLKRRALKVTKVRDTRVLQISITWPAAKQAQALAQFLAEETVRLNRTENHEGDADLIEGAQRRASEAQTRLEAAQTALREFNGREPVEGLRDEVYTLTGLRKTLRSDLIDLRAEIAELASGARNAELAGVSARAANLERQDAELERQIDAKMSLLSQREARSRELEQSLNTASTNYDAAEGQLRGLRASEGMRGERLRIVDPGVIPERPSSPNIALNVALALAVVLIASIAYLTLTFRPNRHPE